MGPSKKNADSALRYPLSTLLGSRGHIGVLRELFNADSPLSHAALLERTDLSRQGVYDVVNRLTETGAVVFIGSGRQQLVTLRADYPFYGHLGVLFAAERDRFKRLQRALTEIIEGLSIKPESAWIFGPAAAGTDSYGEAVQVALLGSLDTIDKLTDEFRANLSARNLEETVDVTVESRGITKADLLTRPYLTEGAIIHIWGLHPLAEKAPSDGTSSQWKSHREIDQKQLNDSKAWSELLASYPEIIPRTVSYLEHEIPKRTSGEKQVLAEWKQILDKMPLQRLKKLIESDSQRANRLRQSLPFWPVLTEHERAKFVSLRQKEVAV